MGKLKKIKHVFTLETHDAFGFPYPKEQVSHTKMPITLIPNDNGTYTILFRNFNFITSNMISNNNYYGTIQGMPPGGFLTTYSNPLPESMRPKEEQTWIIPSNDAYLQNFSYSNPSPPNIIFTATVSADLSSLIDVTNVNSLVVGQPVSDNTNSTLALGTVITSVDYVNNIVTLNQPANGPGSSSYTAGNFPTPLPGLIVSINPYGKLSIFQNGSFAMTIPSGPHTLLSTTVTLVPDDSCKVTPPKNFLIESRFSDISQFTGYWLDDGIRDTHVGDTFEDTVAYSWTGNPNWTALGEQNNNVLDVYICIGKIQTDGKIKLGPVQQITAYGPTSGYMAWDTSIAINRKNPDVIAVSWNFLDNINFYFIAMVSISTDGGNTWGDAQIVPSPTDPYYEIMISQSLGAGDARGVISDKFGNFIYSATLETIYNPPFAAIEVIFFMSSDYGTTWNTIFISDQSTLTNGNYQFDYPQMALGNAGPGLGYGLYFAADLTTFFYDPGTLDIVPYLGFIPISENSIGTPQFIKLNLDNSVVLPCLTLTPEGTLFMLYSSGISDTTCPTVMLTIPPNTTGVLDASLVQGPFTSFQHINGYFQSLASWQQAGETYFTLTVQGFIYDKYRKALYAIANQQPSWYNAKTGQSSQDFDQFMIISTDEGATWSQKFPIASTIKNNRGYASMSFNDKDKSIYISFYDSRNSVGSTQMQILGVILSSKKLDRWTKIAKKN
jgi:hypothetical protein